MRSTLLFLLCFCSTAYAQQPEYMLFNEMATFSNPALMGFEHKHYGALSHKENYFQFDGHPKISSALYEMASKKIHGAVGINGHINRFGFERQTQINLGYAFHLKLGKLQTLSFGISPGINTRSQDYNWPGNLPHGPAKGPSTQFNLNGGIAYGSWRYTVGLSSTQITEPTYEYGYTFTQPKRQYHLYSKYRLFLSRSSVIEPSVMLSTDMDMTNLNLVARYIYKGRYWAGLSYRSTDTYGGMAGATIKKRIQLGLAYNKTVSELSNYGSGSLEFFLAYVVSNSPKKIFKPIVLPNF